MIRILIGLVCLFSSLAAEDPAYTIDARMLDFDSRDNILKAEDVVITFKEGSKLMSRQALINLDSFHGVLSSGEGDELVIYTGFFEDAAGESKPIVVKGRVLMAAIETDQDGTEHVDVTAEGDVVILYDDDFTAYGERAFFRNERKESLAQIVKSGELTLEGEEEGPFARVEHKNGDLIEAVTMKFYPKSRRVEGWGARGSITSIGQLREVTITSDHMMWLPEKNRIQFDGSTTITDEEAGSLSVVGILNIDRESFSVSAPLREMTAKGDIHFTSADGEKGLGCFGTMGVHFLEKKMLLSSPKAENNTTLLSKQSYFDDPMGKIYADQFYVEFTNGPQGLKAETVHMKGNVRMLNRTLPDTHLQNMFEQYAIADYVKYSPKMARMSLQSHKGNRVLYYDKTKGIRVSAPGLVIALKQNRSWEVQGKGNVRMNLTRDEVTLLNDLIPLFQSSGL